MSSNTGYRYYNYTISGNARKNLTKSAAMQAQVMRKLNRVSPEQSQVNVSNFMPKFSDKSLDKRFSRRFGAEVAVRSIVLLYMIMVKNRNRNRNDVY